MDKKTEFKPFSDFSEMALVTAGSMGDYNTMTIGWGGLGTIWGKPVCTVYVRPSRYTMEFMDREEYFTVSIFEGFKKELGYLGSHSGRDGDKVAAVGFEPVEVSNGVTFKQAKRTLVCRKLYKQLMDKSLIPEADVKSYYSGEDSENVHYMYIGEVVEIIE